FADGAYPPIPFLRRASRRLPPGESGSSGGGRLGVLRLHAARLAAAVVPARRGEPATDRLLAGGAGSMEQPRALDDEPVPVTPEAGSTVRWPLVGWSRAAGGASS